MKINIIQDRAVFSLRDFLESKAVDMEAIYALYWKARKESHTGRLPSALEYESWEQFSESDPQAAIQFIQPLQASLLSLFERGDVGEKGSYDLVETGSWLPRQVVHVEVGHRFQEIKPSGEREILFQTEGEWKRD